MLKEKLQKYNKAFSSLFNQFHLEDFLHSLSRHKSISSHELTKQSNAHIHTQTFKKEPRNKGPSILIQTTLKFN